MTNLDIFFFTPIIFLTVSTVFSLFYSLFIRQRVLESINVYFIKYITAYILILTLCLFLYHFNFNFYEYKVVLLQWGSFKTTLFLSVLQCIVVVLALFIIIFSIKYSVIIQAFQSELDTLLLLALVGALLLIWANDLITAYAALELQSIPFYIALALFNKNLIAVETTLKYFILSIIASAIFLFGMSLLYYITGLTNFAELTLFIKIKFDTIINFPFLTFVHKYFFFTALLCICIALLFKLTVAPFFYWVIDIYDNCPLHVVLFLAIIPKFSLIVLFFNFFNVIFDVAVLITFIQPLLYCFSLLSVVLGTLGAFNSYRISTILGYGSVSHIGFVLLALLSNTVTCLAYALLYFFVYSITTILFFIVWLSFTVNNKPIVYVRHLAGLGFLYRFPSILLSIASFSFSGLPPLFGFIVKLLILFDLVGIGFVTWSLVFFVLSLLSAAYYLRFIKLLWFDIEPEKYSRYSYTYKLTKLELFLTLTLVSILIIGTLILLII